MSFKLQFIHCTPHPHLQQGPRQSSRTWRHPRAPGVSVSNFNFNLSSQMVPIISNFSLIMSVKFSTLPLTSVKATTTGPTCPKSVVMSDLSFWSRPVLPAATLNLNTDTQNPAGDGGIQRDFEKSPQYDVEFPRGALHTWWRATHLPLILSKRNFSKVNN